MQKIINLYCDESCHLKNNGPHVSMLGYIGVPYDKIKMHKATIRGIRNKFKIHSEIKWNKVSRSNSAFHEALIDYFMNSEDLVFRGLIIPTGHLGKAHVDGDDYYKMYLRLLSHELNINYTYNIYIDIKDTHSHAKVSELKVNLNAGSIIKHNNVQPIRSYESIFLQLTDLVLGAFTYGLNIQVNDQIDIKKRLTDKLTAHFNEKETQAYRNITKENTDLYLIGIHNYQ
ncbi:MAG: DUF3800 domain-containing protein [Bacteroidota bacterium]